MTGVIRSGTQQPQLARTMMLFSSMTVTIVFTIILTGINGSNTSLCSDEDMGNPLNASLGSTMKFAVCIEAELYSLNYPVVHYQDKWILVDRSHDKFEFTVDRKQSTDSRHVILFTVYNITVEDYGPNELKILTQPNRGLDYTFYINPPGAHEVDFMRLQDEVNTSLLSCYSSWYPRSVSIRKKWSTASKQVVDNTKDISERFALDLLVSSCSETGTYECNITDFDGAVTTKELQVNFHQCPPRLCDWQSSDLTIIAEVNDTVKTAVCLFAAEKFDIQHWLMNENNTTASSNFVVSHTTANDGMFYRYINITVEKVRDVDYGEFNLLIMTSSTGSSVHNVKINLKSKYSTDFCNETLNNSTLEANIGQTKTVSFCVQSAEGLQNVIEINKRNYTISNDTIQSLKYGLVLHRAEKGKYLFAIDIFNVKSNAALNYTVKVHSNFGLTLIYRFSLRLKNGSLKLCKRENNIFTAKLHATAVIHICVTTDAGIGSYLALDNNVGHNSTVLIPVNGSSRKEKYGASAHSKSDNATTDYFIQVYIRNVTPEDFREYRITIKPILNLELKYEFTLEAPMDTTPEFCESEIPKLYYFSTVAENFMLSFCVRTDDAVDDHVWVNEHAHLRKQQTGHVITAHKRLRNPKRHLLTFTFTNITVANFTKYDIRLQFHASEELLFTFYLLEDKGVPALPCPGCTTNPAISSTIGGKALFCFIIYGAMDSDIIINNQTYPIDARHHEPVKFELESQWSETRRINYMKLEVNDIDEGDFTKYDLRLPSIDKLYTFVLHQLKGSFEIKSFTIKSPSRNLERKSSLTLVTRGESIRLTCTADRIPQYMSIADDSGKRIEQATNQSEVVGQIKRFQCDDSWSYLCQARYSQNAKTVSRWIHLAIDECPPRLCFNETNVRTLSTSVGNTSVVLVCIIAYVNSDVRLYWNGYQLSTNGGKYKYSHRRETGNSAKHWIEITITNITSSDFVTHNLSIKLGSKKPLDLQVCISDADVGEKHENRIQNGSMYYIIIVIGGTIIAVLILLAFFLIFFKKVKQCHGQMKFMKTSQHSSTYDSKPPVTEIHEYEEVVDLKKPNRKRLRDCQRPQKNFIYRPKQKADTFAIKYVPSNVRLIPQT
ncbi:unnamed protein product [Lymnaea stagnalis]|uniref:Ig-like domain-containing protein n=1 Tax=Lymnaea stagnalis TaxID=6523 RepID=A0AAV2HSF2_LYMST